MVADILSSNKSLQRVKLENNSFTADGTTGSRTRSLDLMLILCYSGLKDIFTAIKNNSTIHHISFTSNPLGDELAKEFAEVVKSHPSLTSFNLGYCGIKEVRLFNHSSLLKVTRITAPGPSNATDSRPVRARKQVLIRFIGRRQGPAGGC